MRYSGDWLTTVLVGLPIGLSAVLGWPGGTSIPELLGWLGRVTGVGGLACLLVAAIMSVRLPRLDRHFGGLTRLWKQHHYLGLASLLLLMAHVLLMAFSRLPWGLPAMQEVLLPPMADAYMWAGWVALIAMMIFLAPSFQFFGRPDYQRWKAIHFLAGLALVAGVIHAVPLTRTFNLPMTLLVWGGLGGLAILVFFWRALIARPLMRQPWRVEAVRTLADRIVEIELRPTRHRRMDFEPGQFIYFTPHDPALSAGRNEEHPFTISSAPGGDTLKIAVKDLGDASHALQSLNEGSEASVEGPYGLFFPPESRHRKQLWIGGGIGITPFVSAAEAIHQGDWAEHWGEALLINCANDPSRAYYLEQLQQAAQDHPKLAIQSHYFVEHGPLNTDFIRQHCPDAAEREWFVCGPPALTRIARDIARELGVPSSSFHSEEFDFL
ncbi:ferredoxin reductase family protein [Natronospira bacteriovora]|uniref:Ferredoxin reductase family protein n=1 Tax=Natronospira bacteriovora TaxID=3069753 RepID=A0ABU0W476_9GAMM|nr:ferredoxin reductase family protein [Natronospira sp. AB-CW4]MDQ2068825.1 ferredoxin reductase family protein [Natronospira sp. AB-CW4]